MKSASLNGRLVMLRHPYRKNTHSEANFPIACIGALRTDVVLYASKLGWAKSPICAFRFVGMLEGAPCGASGAGSGLWVWWGVPVEERTLPALEGSTTAALHRLPPATIDDDVGCQPTGRCSCQHCCGTQGRLLRPRMHISDCKEGLCRAAAPTVLLCHGLMRG
jgi:hypothetical protein